MSTQLRRAGAEDHPAYARLFAELGVDDPVPDAARFAAELAPRTRELRTGGARRWCLNVEPGNVAAVQLYESLGMRPAYRMAALRFPWALVDALPPQLDDRSTRVTAGPLAPVEDGAVESRFDIARGLLAGRREQGYVVVALHEDGAPVAVAAFQPAHPGAFPFRVARPGLAGPLLAALRPHARPGEPRMQVACENDPALIAGLLAAGATLYLETVHYRGAL